ncbi:MAG: membrane protein insertase YidC [Cellvibrionaceae bacterium]|nr:membrane protein insertase YidC [Cellvibrionaceae bacterium]
MIWLRNALIAAIAVVSFLLFIEWNEFQERHQVEISSSEETLPSAKTLNNETQVAATGLPSEPAGNAVEEIPLAPAQSTSTNDIPQTATTAPQAQLVSVLTDNLEIKIDTYGGDIVKAALRKHKLKLKGEESFILLNRSESHTYVAQSGLVGNNGTATGKQRAIYSVKQTEFKLEDGSDSVIVDLVHQQSEATITKRFTFKRNSYIIDVEFLIDNKSADPWQANLFAQIKRDSYKPAANLGPGIQPFVGAAITTDETNYDKYSLEDLDEDSVKTKKQGGWVAMVQHYFLSAWVPEQNITNNYHLRKLNSQDIYLMGFTSQRTTVPAHGRGSIAAKFYVGPKNIRVLESLAPHLDLTIDYGFLWFIAKPLFYALDWFHSLAGNWGVAIILLTMVIKLVFFYPSALSYRSMAKMRKVQPLMLDLKERFGDDRQKMSMEMMKLYKKEKVNPVSGCLPMLMQMPVFISLYWMIMESVELRHSPFIFWIQDLSVKDQYFILPLVMGAAMWFQQRLNPAPPDPMQAKVMQMMPFVFTAMFLFFPAGLVLYWVVNQTLSIAQQWVITRQIENEGK